MTDHKRVKLNYTSMLLFMLIMLTCKPVFVHADFTANVPGPVLASPKIADVNNDGVNEVVIVSCDGTITVLNVDGSIKWSHQAIRGSFTSAPSIADNGNICINGIVNNKRYAVEYDCSGNLRPGFPALLGEVSGGADHYTVPPMGRLYFEVSNADTRTGLKVQYVGSEGTVVERAKISEWGDTKQEIYGSPACGDIDGDGQSELIIQVIHTSSLPNTPRKAVLYALSGSTVKYKYTLCQSNKVLDPMLGYDYCSTAASGPKLADLDNDGKDEIIASISLGSCYDPNGINSPVLFVLEHVQAGQLTVKWSMSEFITGETFHSPQFVSIGDINNDTCPEIITGVSIDAGTDVQHTQPMIFVFTKDGALYPGWPRKLKEDTSFPYAFNSACIVPVFADSGEIVITNTLPDNSGIYSTPAEWDIFALGSGGYDIPNWNPRPMHGRSRGSMAFGYLDGGNSIHGFVVSFNGFVEAFDVGVHLNVPRTGLWPCEGHDNTNSNSYETEVLSLNIAPEVIVQNRNSRYIAAPGFLCEIETSYRDRDGADDIASFKLSIRQEDDIDHNKIVFTYSLKDGFTADNSAYDDLPFGMIDLQNSSVTRNDEVVTIKWVFTLNRGLEGRNEVRTSCKDSKGRSAEKEIGILDMLGDDPGSGVITPCSGNIPLYEKVYFTAAYNVPATQAGEVLGSVLIATGTINQSAYVNLIADLSNQAWRFGTLKLMNDNGIGVAGSAKAGSSCIIENSYVYIDCADSSVTKKGNVVIVRWALTFKEPYKGYKNVYTHRYPDLVNPGQSWVYKGFIKIDHDVTQSYALGQVTPVSRTRYEPGEWYTISSEYMDFRPSYARGEMQQAKILLKTPDENLARCVRIEYEPDTRKVRLYNDDGTGYTEALINQDIKLENSYVVLDCKNMDVDFTTIQELYYSYEKMKISWRVAFKRDFTGEKNIYTAMDMGSYGSMDWEKRGRAFICYAETPISLTTLPSPGSVRPGQEVMLTALYYKPTLTEDPYNSVCYQINSMVYAIEATPGVAKDNIYFYCLRTAPYQYEFFLLNDAGTGPVARTGNTLENSSVSIDCSKTVVEGSGHYMTMRIAATFKKNFRGVKQICTDVSSIDGKTEGLKIIGPYQVLNFLPQANNVVFERESHEPGQEEKIMATYTDADGASDLNDCVLFIRTYPESKIHCMYAWYNQNENKLHLLDNVGNYDGVGYTPGLDGSPELKNDYVTINCKDTRVIPVENGFTVKWSVKFSNKFRGDKEIFTIVSDDMNEVSGWKYHGQMAVLNSVPASGTVTPGAGEFKALRPCKFRTVYTDKNGADDLRYCVFLIQTYPGSPAHCMYAVYNKESNEIYLLDNEGNDTGARYTPGEESRDVLKNDYVIINSKDTQVRPVENGVEIDWAVTFMDEFIGEKVMWTTVSDIMGGYEEWTQKGAITVKPSNVAPVIDIFDSGVKDGYVSIDDFVTYSIMVSDADGIGNIEKCGIRIKFNGQDENIDVVFNNVTKEVSLAGSGEVVKTFNNTPSDSRPKYMSNIYATVDCDNTIASVVNYEGKQAMSFSVRLALSKRFSGKKELSAYVTDISGKDAREYSSLTVLAESVFADIDAYQGDEIIINRSLANGLGILNRGAAGPVKFHSVVPDMMIKANMESAEKDNLVVDFGSEYGMYMLGIDGAWRSIHGTSPDTMVAADIDGDGLDELVVDFGKSGIYAYFIHREGDLKWEKIHDMNPRIMTEGDVDNDDKDEVIVDFGGCGVWIMNYGSDWVWLHDMSPDEMITGDSDNDGYDEINIDFGINGLWRVKLDPLLEETKKWVKLHSCNTRELTSCDIDGDGKSDVIVDFFDEGKGTEYGIFSLDGRSGWVGKKYLLYWDKLHQAKGYAINNGDFDQRTAGDELLVDFGPEHGLWIKNVIDQNTGVTDWKKFNN